MDFRAQGWGLLGSCSQWSEKPIFMASIWAIRMFYVTIHAHSLSCVWLCSLMDCSLPGSSALGIFQAGILEWVAISYSRGSSQPRDSTHISCVDSLPYSPPGKPFYMSSCTQSIVEWSLIHISKEWRVKSPRDSCVLFIQKWPWSP